MHNYKCRCGYTTEHYLKIRNPCPECNDKLTEIKGEEFKTHYYEKDDLPMSKKFSPIYYGDQLWYYRRQPKNSEKRILKFMKNKLRKKL